MAWQILNTGALASQGSNKLNFRNDSAGTDVMTLTASGQVGIGTNSPTGTLDVQGSIATSGNASQARTAGGMVKAMFLFSPFNGGGIEQCYNSTLPGAAATTSPCGFSIIDNFHGDYILDLGFQIDDRILSATVMQSGLTAGACTDNSLKGACNNLGTLTPNRVEVTVFAPAITSYFDDKVFLVVY